MVFFAAFPHCYLAIEYFASERGCMIMLRAQKLVEDKCDYYAMKFIRQAFRAIRSCTEAHPLRQVVSFRQHIVLLGIYLSLLYKYKKVDELKAELELMSFETAKDFILLSFASVKDEEEKLNKQRIEAMQAANDANTTSQNKRKKKQDKKEEKKSNRKSTKAQQVSTTPDVVNIPKPTNASRLHKYHILVNQYALQLILVRILSTNDVVDLEGNENGIGDLLKLWIEENKHRDNFADLFRQLVQRAKADGTIFSICEFYHQTVSKKKYRVTQNFDGIKALKFSRSLLISVSDGSRNSAAHILFPAHQPPQRVGRKEIRRRR